MIWSSIAEKGGSGKTTFITNLAVQFALDGKRVLALDFDPMGSLSTWGSSRAMQDDATQGITVLSAASHVPSEVIARVNLDDFDELVLDVPGSDSEYLRQTLLLSDVCVMPSVPGGFDFTSYAHTLEVIEQAIEIKARQNEALVACLFLNRTRYNSTVARLTRQHIDTHLNQAHLLESELAWLDDFPLAGQMGYGVSEYAKRGTAAKQIRKLVEELSAHAGVSS